MSERALAGARLFASEGDAAGFDDDYESSWGPLKPYLADEGQTLVIPVMDVIADSFWGSGLSAKSVQRALLKHKAATKIKVIVNSPGGDVSQGIAVYTQLRMDGRPVEVHVIGLAASMASIVMLAGDTRILHTGSMVMVHEPWTWTAGDRHDFRSGADMLDAVANSMLDIYVERTGANRDELGTLMAAETWLTADEARRLGFGTEVAPAEPEPLQAQAAADPQWHQRRGAALARHECKSLPDEVRRDAPLGWRGPSLEELQAANALARANQIPTFAMALDGVRRARPLAQQPQPREATPPPRPAQPQPAASTSRTTSMDEETLRELGLGPGASSAEIKAAIKAQKERAAAAEAKAQEAALEAKLAKEQREREEKAAAEAKVRAEREAAEAKVLADHTVEVTAFLADITDGVKADLEAMAYTEVSQPDGSKKRVPNPDGFARAKRLADSNPAARKSTLAGPSAQVQAARQTLATTPPASTGATAKGPVKYRFAGATQEHDLTRIAGVTHEMVAERQALMKARAESRGQRVDD
jgi:ATP-dependent protease ClpP protease subunit